MNREQQLQHRRECEGCGASERRFLHNVRQRGAYRRLCTDCLLKNHQGLFCPVCLQVFDDGRPPPHACLICLSCPSITHLSCSPPSSTAPAPATTPSPCFTCPPCSDPNFSFFSPSPAKKTPKSELTTDTGVDSSDDGDGAGMVVDKAKAKALVAAAKIAADSMAREVAIARIEADKRVKEAAVARKRAREALEQVVFLATRQSDSTNPNNNKNISSSKSVSPNDGITGSPV